MTQRFELVFYVLMSGCRSSVSKGISFMLFSRRVSIAPRYDSTLDPNRLFFTSCHALSMLCCS